MQKRNILPVFIIACGFWVLVFTTGYSQYNPGPVIITQGETKEQIIKKAANITPSKRQYDWQKLEFTAFIHFGINTFDEVEWGTKNSDISKFNPVELDCRQWVSVLKDAGAKLIILTTKHHDGFSLWPTKYKKLNIANTPFQNGKGDIVRDLSNACREAGIKFGVYLSPWDMHEDFYGTPEYNTFFLNQLTELLTNYGKVDEVWFDGAIGEGPNGKKQEYDWQAYYKLIRKLQPDAVISICGPDVRWVGTESGYGRQTEWSVLPGSNANEDEVAAKSQQERGEGAFIPKDLSDDDLGSRSKIEKASSLIWYPAEIDVSIRPGWFYKQSQDKRVKSPYKLVDIYYNSVGLNGVLLLNVPPDKRGLITQYDIDALKGMRYLLDETFKTNYTWNCKTMASSEKPGNEAKFLVDDKPETYWTTEGELSTASIEIDLGKMVAFDRAMLQENILSGQRIEKFHLEFRNGGKWTKFVEATTIGFKRLLKFPEVTTDKIKIVIDESRTNPTLASFGVYKAPPEIVFSPEGCSFADEINIKLNCNTGNSKIYYSLDGSTPDEKSLLYDGGIKADKSTTLTAIAVSEEGKKSLPVKADFNKAKYKIEYKSNYDGRYPGSGPYTLVDGIRGSGSYKDGKWLGFYGNDLDVVIDLGSNKNISKIISGFMRDFDAHSFYPKSIEYSISDDSKDFRLIGALKYEQDPSNGIDEIKPFSIEPKNVKGRYVRIKAINIGFCPNWHKGAGEKAWLFCDEITVE